MFRLTRPRVSLAFAHTLVFLICVGCGSPTEDIAKNVAPSETTVTLSPPSNNQAISTPRDATATAVITNLLDQVKVGEDLLRGEAKREGLTIVTHAKQNPALIRLRSELPPAYSIRCDVERIEGDGPAFLGLLVNGARCLLTVDGFPENGAFTGISLIDGKSVHQVGYPAKSHRGALLRNDQRATIRCQVNADTLIVNVDGREVFRWKVDATRLSVRPFFETDPPALSFGSAKSVIRFHRYELKPLTTQQAAARTPTPQATSRSSQAATLLSENQPPDRIERPALAPTSPDQWALIRRGGDLEDWLTNEQASLEAASNGDVQVNAIDGGKPIQLVFRNQLQGDFRLQARVQFPPRNKVGGKMTGASYFGFRSVIDGVEKLCPLSLVGADGGVHSISILRVGKRLSFRIDDTTIPTEKAEIETPGYFVLQVIAPTSLQVNGLHVEGASGVRLVRDSSAATNPRPNLVRSAGSWGLKTTGTTSYDQKIYDHVELAVNPKGIRVSKSIATKQIELLYLQDFDEDFWANLNVQIPEGTLRGGQPPGVYLNVGPAGRSGSHISIPVPRGVNNAAFQIQKSGELVVANLAATQNTRSTSTTLRIRPPIRVSLRIDRGGELEIIGPEVKRFDGSPTKVLGDENVTQRVRLPAQVDAAVPVAGGSFWLLRFGQLRKAGLFDVEKDEIVGYLSLEDPNAIIAGGLDRLFVVSPSSGEVTRYTIDELKQEFTQKLPLDGIQAAAMGSASSGPLLVAGSRGVVPFDTKTLRPIETNPVAPRGAQAGEHGLFASADGNWFGVDGRGVASLIAYSYDAKTLTAQSGGEQLVPGPLGRLVHGDRPRLPNLEPLTMDGLSWDLPTIPSTREPFYLSIYRDGYRNPDGTADQLVSIHASNQAKPLVSWNWQRQPNQNATSGQSETDLPDQKRLLFHVPLGKVLSIDDPADTISIRQFNLVELLNESSVDEPVITSLPRLEAIPAEPYRYQIEGWSRDGELITEMLSGPDGMTVSGDGEVAWSPKVSAGHGVEWILIRVYDGVGRETFHAYQLRVVGSESNDPRSPVIPSVTGEDQREHPANQIDLPAPYHRAVPCGGGRYLALHLPSRRRVAIADLRDGKIVGYATANAENALIAGTRDALYVIDTQRLAVKKWLLADVTSIWEKQLPGSWIPSMAAGGCSSAGPLLLADQNGSAYLLQTDELTVTSIGSESSSQRFGKSPLVRLEAAPDGTVFAVMRMAFNRAPSYLLTRKPTGGYTTVSTKFLGQRAVFNADGSRIYGQRGVYSVDGQRELETIDPTIPAYTVPALQGPFFARYTAQEFGTSSRPAAAARFQLFIEDQERALVTLPAASLIDGKLIGSDGDGGVDVGERMFLAPAEGVLAVLPLNNDVIRIHRFELDKVLGEAAIDYLFVMSAPQTVAQAGERYEYPIVAKSSTGSVQFSLETGPEGASLSAEGKLSWQVPHSKERSEEAVIIKVSNSNAERFHSFMIQVNPSAPEDPEGADAFREWTELATGRKVEARMVEIVDEAIQLERRDGREFVVPISRLSDKDRAFVRGLQKRE